MEFINNKTIRIDKELNELDKICFSFIDILKGHVDYIVVSGYVAILFGRTRGTEDVDILIPKISKDKFNRLYIDVMENNFWCINTDDEDEIYSLLDSCHSIRFALKDMIQPNFELKFVSNKLHEISMKEKIKIIIGEREFWTSSIEMQIAYKENMLGSDKDKEDAAHLRELFGKNLNFSLIEKYKKMIVEELKGK